MKKISLLVFALPLLVGGLLFISGCGKDPMPPDTYLPADMSEEELNAFYQEHGYPQFNQ